MAFAYNTFLFFDFTNAGAEQDRVPVKIPNRDCKFPWLVATIQQTAVVSSGYRSDRHSRIRRKQSFRGMQRRQSLAKWK